MGKPLKELKTGWQYLCIYEVLKFVQEKGHILVPAY